jgi:hypothetical protein
MESEYFAYELDQFRIKVNEWELGIVPLMSNASEKGLFQRISSQLTYFMQLAKSVDSPRDVLRFLSTPSGQPPQHGPVVLLSRVYPSVEDIDFLDGRLLLM